MSAVGDDEFAGLLAGLGPFEPAPKVAVAVSGGADSLALALLAHRWARGRGGDALGLIVDHGLRPSAAVEAAQTRERLTAHGIGARVLSLAGLRPGAGVAARARTARYAALETACAAEGRLHLLLGHHAADQAETVAMRLLAGSQDAGLAAMPALRETAQVRLLRPLLTVPPVRLRTTLRAAGLDWLDDPSNGDPAALRARLRLARRDRDGTGPATRAMVEAAAARGRARARQERETAGVLAERAVMSPYGYVLLTPGTLPAAALAALLGMVSGSHWPPALSTVAALAGGLRAGTLGGARIMPAGRLLPGGWLLLREAAGMAPAIPAIPGARWDRRFRLGAAAVPPDDAELGALGEDAVALRRHCHLPAALLRTLPAIRVGGKLVAVPQLGYPDPMWFARCPLRFAPDSAAAAAPFLPPPAGLAGGNR